MIHVMNSQRGPSPSASSIRRMEARRRDRSLRRATDAVRSDAAASGGRPRSLAGQAQQALELDEQTEAGRFYRPWMASVQVWAAVGKIWVLVICYGTGREVRTRLARERRGMMK